MEEPGLVFYVTRSIQKAEHNQLFQECYCCIRKYYTNKIICIDDNSNPELVEEVDVSNCEILHSEFPGAGEVLPYYYYARRQDAEKAVFLHDSMFLNGALPLTDINEYRFIWHFNKDSEDIFERADAIDLTQYTYEPYFLKRILEKSPWKGCFGGCMILTGEFAKKMDSVLNFSVLVNQIRTRRFRMAFERLVGVGAHVVCQKDTDEVSLLGSIHDYDMHSRAGYAWGSYTFDEYLKQKSRSMIIKVWNAR